MIEDAWVQTAEEEGSEAAETAILQKGQISSAQPFVSLLEMQDGLPIYSIPWEFKNNTKDKTSFEGDASSVA